MCVIRESAFGIECLIIGDYFIVTRQVAALHRLWRASPLELTDIQGAPIKNNPLEKILYLRNCSRFFHQIYAVYRGRFRTDRAWFSHILRHPARTWSRSILSNRSPHWECQGPEFIRQYAQCYLLRRYYLVVKLPGRHGWAAGTRVCSARSRRRTVLPAWNNWRPSSSFAVLCQLRSPDSADKPTNTADTIIIIIIIITLVIYSRGRFKIDKNKLKGYDAQSVQSGTGRLRCSRTALKRCTSTETRWYRWL